MNRNLNRRYIVKLEPGCWIADWEGDPGRTLVESNAKSFGSLKSAGQALALARVFRSFKIAEII